MKKIHIMFINIALVNALAADINPYGFIRFNGAWGYGVNGVNYAEVNDLKFKRASSFDFSANQSTFGIDISDSTSEGWLILTGKLEGDFLYNNLRLNHSFINLSFQNIGLNILFGKTRGLFVPYNPPTVNYYELVGAGNLDEKRSQIRLTQKLSSAEVAIAARNDVYHQSYSAVEGRINTTKPIKVGISAYYAAEQIAGRLNIHQKEEEKPASWGIAADLFAPIGNVNISGEFFRGQNLSNYGGIFRPYLNSGIEYGVKSIGGWGALGFKASDDLSFNAGAGTEQITEIGGEGVYYSFMPWFNRAIFANINYKLTKSLTFALEYCRLDTEYVDESKASFDRIEVVATYEF
jgi:hypothetical protein